MRADGGFNTKPLEVCFVDPMSRAQGLRLRRLSVEAYQPTQYARDLTFGEAARIAALEAEIALADSF